MNPKLLALTIDLIQSGQTATRRHAERRLANELAVAAHLHMGAIDEIVADSPRILNQRLVSAISAELSERDHKLRTLRQRYSQYSRLLSQSQSETERRRHILELARDLGASARQLRGDERAFDRWFGHEAVTDRYTRQFAENERFIGYCLERLGIVVREVLTPLTDSRVAYWRTTALETVALPYLHHAGDPRIRLAAFRCLTTAVTGLDQVDREQSLSSKALQAIYRAALNRQQDVWIQCEALSLLAQMRAESLAAALESRLRLPGEADDIFVRRRCVELLATTEGGQRALDLLLTLALKDKSPWVRQGLADNIGRVPQQWVEKSLTQLVLNDSEPSVRAAACVTCLELVEVREMIQVTLKTLTTSLQQETDEFVLRAALRSVSLCFIEIGRFATSQDVNTWHDTLAPVLKILHTEHASLTVRRWTAQVLEILWVYSDQKRIETFDTLQLALGGLGVGKRIKIKRDMFAGMPLEETARLLSVMAQDDRGYDIIVRRKSLIILRGHSRRFRLWRTLHELRHPATDKRQAHRHTIGRVFYGTLRTPSSIMSELARTKVPGEPLFFGTEGGWRPYVPIVDELVSAMDNGQQSTRIFTPEGETRIDPPPRFLGRLRARAHLCFKFAHLANLRNWQEDSQDEPSAYTQAVKALGIDISHHPHLDRHGSPRAIDKSVARYFPLAIPLPFGLTFEDMHEYFLSPFDNSLQELTIFMSVLVVIFLGRHLWNNHKHRHARNAIPLVIGGWGTRGKSGTERIKAALLSALGYSIVSKTTGCEAMFLYSYPYGTTREMFLFRPYDKATIWEQTNIVQLSAKLNADCFIWECMGLTPSYVDILQRQWMRDDLATITNTYPDHEDVQGPAGIDVSEVMINFIPPGTTLFTTEEQMLPVLTDGARPRSTKVIDVGWLQAGLITPDIIERFPYEEHPYNMALVLAMADSLGVGRDFALKEMADRVVADLGVLKLYPRASVNHRQIEFINGCSANERFGCMNNWNRMHFIDADPYASPDVWITTVVNNRADRIPRSKVFADMLADSLYADRHFLIGTNLNGLQEYIRESWHNYTANVRLFNDADGADTPLQVLQTYTRKIRGPMLAEHVAGRLQAMLEGLGHTDTSSLCQSLTDNDDISSQLTMIEEDSVRDSVAGFHKDNVMMLRDYQQLVDQLDAANGADESIQATFLQFLETWFHHRIVLFEDAHMTGEQIIDRICHLTPPGVVNRCMGLQNIKGTGLDFVYRWQAWERCEEACAKLRDSDIRQIRQGIDELSGFKEFGVLSRDAVFEVIEKVRFSEHAQDGGLQAELSLIEENFAGQMNSIDAGLTQSSETGPGWLALVADYIEGVFDGGDAIKRRKRADLVYRDLAKERIGQQQAVKELQELTKRQKGGWLYKDLQKRFAPISRHWLSVQRAVSARFSRPSAAKKLELDKTLGSNS